MSSSGSAWTLLGSLYAAAGLLVLSSTLLPAASAARNSGVVQLLDAGAVLVAVALLLLARTLPAVLLNAVVFLSSVLITAAVMVSGGGSTAMAYATVYIVGPIYCRFVLDRRAANVQLLLVMALGIPALALQRGVGAAEQVILWGVAIMVCAAVEWLVGALERAESDTLTGLLNRRGVERVLADHLPPTATDGHLGFALIEIDHFRRVNQSLGRTGADRLLVDTARKWQGLVERRERLGYLGRFSADGFALVLPGADLAQTTALVDELRGALPRGVSCSAGAVASEHGESPSMLVARTDGAVYVAKQLGRDRTYTHPGVGSEGRALRTALAAGEFEVYFQPIVDLSDGSPVGAEALVRWNHPLRGLLSPAEFLPEAEQSGVIIDIGDFVLRRACTAAASWPQLPDGRHLHVSVNASAQELTDPLYASRVRQALAASGLDAGRLVLELVESHYEADATHVVSNLHTLRALGVLTAIDDFGMGHSSLDRLRRLGADGLKIDKSFVADIVSLDQSAPMVLAVLVLAGAMDLRVVAEGVETVEQAEWLRRHGCVNAQGYLYGRPAVEGDMTRLVRQASLAPTT